MNLKRILIMSLIGGVLFVNCVKNNLGQHNMRGLKMNRLRSICLRNKFYKLPKLHRHGQYSFSNSITSNVKTDFKKRIIPISSVLGITGASYYLYNNYKNKQNNFSNASNNKHVKKPKTIPYLKKHSSSQYTYEVINHKYVNNIGHGSLNCVWKVTGYGSNNPKYQCRESEIFFYNDSFISDKPDLWPVIGPVSFAPNTNIRDLDENEINIFNEEILKYETELKREEEKFLIVY